MRRAPEKGGENLPNDSGSSVSASETHFWSFGRAEVNIVATCCYDEYANETA
jgi:hypothetical protein